MFDLLKNALSGKNTVFANTFRDPHRRFLQALVQFPPPMNSVDPAFLHRLRGYIDGTCEFAHALFYGLNGRPAVCSDADLRSLGVSNGERLFSLLLIGLIRCSLPAENQFGDEFCAAAALVIPESVKPAAHRFAAALRVSDPMDRERTLVGVVRQIFPRVRDDPRTRIQFTTYFFAFAAVLNQQTLSALSD